MKILETQGLSKKYKNIYAVDNVSMQINEGDIYGFVGENGAGKTTFIRLVSGLITPSGGLYTLFEGESHHLGAVVETPSLYLNMTAMDNLLMQAKIIGKIDIKKHEELLHMVKLEYLIQSKKKAKDFSLGMRQRLGIAMSLLSNPKLILLDEPMNGLDPEGVVLMRNLILSLRDQGITFLISSHMLSELSKVASRYGFIHKGKLIHEISKEELESKAAHVTEFKLDPSAIDKARQLLEGYQVDVYNNTLKVYGNIDVNEVILMFAKENIVIKGIHQESDNIEQYYLDIIGGYNG